MGLNSKTISKFIPLIILLIGFVLGRSLFTPKPTIKYIKSEPIRDTIVNILPYKVEVPSNPVYPVISDTILTDTTKIVVNQVDTLSIVKNYIRKKYYSKTLFDNDTIGSLIVDAVIQYNELRNLSYTFIPVRKIIKIKPERLYTPFLSLGVSNNGYTRIGGGVYYKHIGLSSSYWSSTSNKFISMSLNYKF